MSLPAPPTIHDVAARAGVSRSTVSRILNNPSAGPSTTRTAVEAAVRELGYRPSSAARSLRSGRSDLIAFVVGDIRQPYFSSLARALEHTAEESDRRVLLFDIDRSLDRLRDTLVRVRSLPLAGLVVAVGMDIDVPEVREALEHMRRDGLNVVTTTQHLSYTPIPSVTVSHAETAFHAAEDLRGRGHQRIALVAGQPDAPHVKDTVRGFLDAHSARDRAEAEQLVVNGSFQIGSSEAAVADLLRTTSPPEAFITTSTFATLGLLNALEDAGMRGTVDIVCTEHTEVLSYLRPSVTSYGVDYSEYARAILDTLDSAPGHASSKVIPATPTAPPTAR